LSVYAAIEMAHAFLSNTRAEGAATPRKTGIIGQPSNSTDLFFPVI
jgi:hypothetical protein